MRPLSIHARNYRTYEELDLELPAGCVAILGENGAGKSSILQVIELALFGPRSRTLADYLTADSAETEMTVALYFEHRDTVYRVRRSYSARGRGQTKLDLERLEEHMAYHPGHSDSGPDEYSAIAWTPLTRETAKETQAVIEDLLGLTRETFRASAFLAQGDSGAFTEAEPRQRKQILAEILDLQVWEQLLALVAADRKNADRELDRLNARLEMADGELAARPSVVAERDAHAVEKQAADELLAAAEEVLTSTEGTAARAREAAAARAGAEQALAAAEKAFAETSGRIDRLNDEHMALQEELGDKAALEQLAGRVTEFEAMAQAAQDLRAYDSQRAELQRSLERSTAERASATAEIDRISKAETPECPMCGQEMHAKARQNTLKELRARRDGWHSAIEDASRQLLGLEQACAGAVERRGNPAIDIAATLRDARDAATRLAALAEKERRLVAISEEAEHSSELRLRQADDVHTAKARLDEIPAGPDIETLTRAAADARLVRDAHRARVDELDRAITRCDDRLERLSATEAASAADREARDRLVESTGVLAHLERAFGRDGIPALILENAAIPQIEVEANRILQDLGTAFRVELRTQKALKSGDGIREALDIIVIAGGVERPYETFSGGERTRLNLALRIALARLLAHRRGADVRFLAIDEPEFLDEAGIARLADVLQTLTGDFDTIAVVSHQPSLREAFDQTIHVVNDDGRSTIVAHAQAEAVIA